MVQVKRYRATNSVGVTPTIMHTGSRDHGDHHKQDGRPGPVQLKQYPDYSLSASDHSAAKCNQHPTFALHL